jgi:aspartyl-tRNA(Asn)/glutamyl-tRNA(Gln) amidotransferase subunit C
MAQQIDEAQVRHIGHLSRLDLSDDEVKRFGEQLSSILAYVDKLNEVNTEGVEPSAYPLAVHNVYRDDEIGTSFTTEQAMANAPDHDGTFFKVPKVLDQGSGA